MTDPQPAPTVVDGVDVDAVHAAVTACPGVARVGSPGVASLTTYLPGRRVPGIRINPDSVELEVVAAWGSSTAEISTHIRNAIAGLIKGRPVAITVADIDLPEAAGKASAIPDVPAMP